MTTRTEFDDGRVELRVSRFLDVDSAGATYETGDMRSRVSWLDLQAHASFPADATHIDQVAIETPLGRHDCLRYDVEREGRRHIFWFAKKRPGMPIRVVVQEAGRTLSTSTVVADEVVPPVQT